MTEGQRAGHRWRHLILVAGILYTGAALCWLVLPYFHEALFCALSYEFLGTGLIGTPLIF